MSTKNMAKRTAASTLALAVCLGGGALAAAGAAHADSSFTFKRVASGSDRFDTAVLASQTAYSTATGKHADAVVIVNGYRSVDGLTASTLAGHVNGPVLYSDGDHLTDETAAEIKRLGVKKVYLVGGTAVLSDDLESGLKDDYTVTRVGGEDRYDTAAQVADMSVGAGVDTVFVASGNDKYLADSVTVSSIAYAKGFPILYTDTDDTSSYTTDELSALKAKGVKHIHVLGGSAAVSDDVVSDLGADRPFAGADRGATADMVSDWAKANLGFSTEAAALVGPDNGAIADSLVSSAFLAQQLIVPQFAGWDSTNAYLKLHSKDLTGAGFVFGGTTAVTNDDLQDAQDAAQSADVAAAASYIVTDASSANAGQFSYADPESGKVIVQKFASTDSFSVDGTKSTIGVFTSSLSLGDQITFTTSGTSTAFSLTSKTASDYTSGQIGAADGTNITIVEPVSGAPLNVLGETGNYTLYSVDGASVSKTVFDSSVQPGDTVSYTGTGADASNIRTISVTNKTVTGTVTGSTASAGTFSIQPAKVKAVGVFTAGANDTITVDGKSADLPGLKAALSDGDSVSVSKKGGVQTIALTNAAPQPVKGQITSATQHLGQLQSFTYVGAGASGATTVTPSTAVTMSTTTTAGASAKQQDTLVFTNAPYGLAANLTVTWTGTGTLAGKSVTVGIPNSGVAATDQSTMVTSLQAAINATGVSGIVVAAGGDVKTFTFTGNANNAPSGTPDAVAFTPFVVTVDGALASGADLTSAVTLGDTVVYQPADAATSTKNRIDLTNAGFGGVVDGDLVSTSSPHAVGIYADGSTTVGLGAVDYTSPSAAGLSGSSVAYVVNGATVAQSKFETSLTGIKNGALMGTIKVSQVGTVTTFALSTSVAS